MNGPSFHGLASVLLNLPPSCSSGCYRWDARDDEDDDDDDDDKP
jgi:hypothetical protein